MRDTVAHQLREEGTGTAMRYTEVLSYEEEELHQEREILGIESPRSLFIAAFYFMNGKVLCLRGGCKHKDLKLSVFLWKGRRLKLLSIQKVDLKNYSGSY